MLQLEKDKRCFVCGVENPHSLKIKVEQGGPNQVKCEFIGIFSLVFDEMLGWLSRYMGHDAMTSRLEVRYRKPVPLGSKLIFSGALEREVKGILDIKLCANLEDGSVAAEGKGRMIIIKH